MSTEGVHATAALAQLFDVLGEPVEHWPQGKQENRETVLAMIDRTDQTPMHARVEDGGGRKIVRHATLVLYRSVVVSEAQDTLKCSVFVFDSLKWHAITVHSTDEGGQEVSVQSTTDGMGFTKPGR